MKIATNHLLSALVLALLAAGSMLGQSTADILGRITDTQGAQIPQAKVTLVNVDTNESRIEESNDAGDFVFTPLIPGKYKLRVEKPGFKVFEVPEIVVAGGDRTRADAQLSLGQATETVEVSAAVTGLQTDSSSVGTSVTGRLVQDIPLNGRNYVQLTQLIPGVTSGPPNGLATGSRPDDRRPNSSFSVNGLDPILNNNMIDGMDNNERFIGTLGVRPSIDAISEMKVQTNLYSAEVGRTAGGVVNIITKSGTNDFHGTLFEFLRNDWLDANQNYNFTGTQLAKSEYRQNQYGGSIGGPIKKDKTFFFGDYEKLSIRQGVTITAIVPTAQQRVGNLGQNCTSRGGTFSAAGICSVAAGQLTVVNPIAGIPAGPVPFNDLTLAPYASALDPVGLNYASIYPLPTSSGVNQSNYVTAPVRQQDLNTFDTRIDHKFSESTYFYARYSFNNVVTLTPTGFPNVSIGGTTLNPGGSFAASDFSGTNNSRAQNLQLNLVRILSPTLVLELKASIARTAISSYSVNNGKNVATALGFPCTATSCVNLGDIQTSGIPRVLFGGSQYNELGDVRFVPLLEADNTFDYAGTLAWTHGAHSIKTGASLIARQFSDVQSAAARGWYTFNPSTSSAPSTTNDALANLLFGTPTAINRNAALYKPYYRSKEAGFFVQDDWRATKWLTLNLGLRYDLYPPKKEKYGHLANFNPYTLQTLVPGVNGVNAYDGINPDYKTLAPRIGFAVTLPHNYVLRGGWGLSYFPVDYTSNAALKNPPFANAFTCGPGAGAACPTGFGLLREGAPNPISPSAYATNSNGTLNLTQIFPVSLSAMDTDFRNAHMQQFNVIVEKQFGNNVISAGYVGLRGANLGQVLPDINRGLPTGTTATSPRLFAAFPLVGQVTYFTTHGSSNYDALQLSFNRRLGKGLSFTAGYTEARDKDNVSGIGPSIGGYGNLIGPLPQAINNVNSYDWGNSEFSIPHKFTFAGNYDLPFGRNLTGAAKQVLANWQMNGTFSWQTGLPITVADSTAVSGVVGIGGGVERPNLTGQPLVVSNPTVGTSGQWLNPAAFALPSAGTLGNAPRGVLYGPNQNAINMSLFKTFALTEKYHLEFRTEVYNLPNHPVFDRPAFTNFGSASFGKITSLAPGYPLRQLQLALKLLF